MSYQERKTLTNLIGTVLVNVIYWIIIYNRYLSGAFDTENMLRFFAVVILILVPVSIVGRIVTTIVFSIINSIINEVKGEEQDEDIIDERDQLYELKAMRVSLVFFSVGFIVALLLVLFNYSISHFFITIIIFGFLSEVVGNIYTLCKYRLG